MKRLAALFMPLLFSTQILASEAVKECIPVFEKLAEEYLKKHPETLSAFGVKQSEYEVKFKVDGPLKLHRAVDLTPGSYGIVRRLDFTNQENQKIALYTTGFYFCSNEEVLGIAAIDLNDDLQGLGWSMYDDSSDNRREFF